MYWSYCFIWMHLPRYEIIDVCIYLGRRHTISTNWHLHLSCDVGYGSEAGVIKGEHDSNKLILLFDWIRT